MLSAKHLRQPLFAVIIAEAAGWLNGSLHREADWNRANEMKGLDAACREDFGGLERLNEEYWGQRRFIC
jgi:hypothetical protein